jgi:hypothetical protein
MSDFFNASGLAAVGTTIAALLSALIALYTSRFNLKHERRIRDARARHAEAIRDLTDAYSRLSPDEQELALRKLQERDVTGDSQPSKASKPAAEKKPPQAD